MTLERTYNVPLRKEWLKAPMYRRSKKAVTALTEFAAKNMKTSIENVKIGKQVNLLIWKNGIKNPPHHVKVNMVKEDDGIVKV
jgi:ribosomal protein L31E